VPWSRDVLDLAEVIVSELFVAAVVLVTQVGNTLAVGVGQALPDGALGYVATDVLLVVGFLFGPFDLARQVEHPNLLLLGLVEVEYELLAGLLRSLLLLREEVLFTRPVPICRRVEELLHRVGAAQLELGQGRANQERRTTHVKERRHTTDGCKRNEILSLGASGCRSLRAPGHYRVISLINILVNTGAKAKTLSKQQWQTSNMMLSTIENMQQTEYKGIHAHN